VHEGEVVPLHGFIKKTRKTPNEDRALALNARMPFSKAARNKNKHRGSSFESFLKEEGLREEVHAAALKRALALKLTT
jgi:hypothetical protein